MKITIDSKAESPRKYTFDEAMAETGVFQVHDDKSVYCAFDGRDCIIVLDGDLDFGIEAKDKWKGNVFIKSDAKIIIQN